MQVCITGLDRGAKWRDNGGGGIRDKSHYQGYPSPHSSPASLPCPGPGGETREGVRVDKMVMVWCPLLTSLLRSGDAEHALYVI
jgi:hypothetical protein